MADIIDDSYVPKLLRSLTEEAETWRPYASRDEASVLVIYTGGTIGMVKDDDGVLKPAPGILDKRLREFPQLHDAEYEKKHFPDCENPPLVLPLTGDPRRVVYTISEYDPLIDSSNATMDDWIRIARDIKERYEKYHGFVILHGTDTMAYTSSALSFLLEFLGKSVVVTGSQIPVFEPRSDGRENLLNALILAGNYVIPEVTLMFHHQLFRGNRVTKFSIAHLDAFASINMAPLVTIGINVEVNWRLIRPGPKGKELQAQTTLNRDVGLLRLFPSIALSVVEAFLDPPVQGVVLQTYGAGNGPTARKDIMDAIRKATGRGVLILNCSQCLHGGVDPSYETGNELLQAGVIPGADMTPEAALTKLSYVLSKSEWSLEEKKQVEAFLDPPVQGVVLQTYGAGNGPTARKDIMDAIRKATGRGVLILNCSQCLHGGVDPSYETGNELLQAGVIPGADMTPEAALTKLSYVLSKSEWTLEEKKQRLQEDLRGELTAGAVKGWRDQYNVSNLFGPWKTLFIR